MLGYRRQMTRDVERWREAGWLTPAGVEGLRAEAAVQGIWQFGLAGSFAIVAAILIGFSAMSYVAANWQAMSKLARLALIFGALWTCYGAAAWLFVRRLDLFAHAATLAGTAVFGAGIMLIAQMYHLDGNPPDTVLVWSLGALAAGLILRSPPSLAAAAVLATLWTGWETVMLGPVHWAFLPLWAVIAAAFAWLGWERGISVSALALSAWVIMLGWRPFWYSADANVTVALVAISVVVAAGAAATLRDRLEPVTAAAAHHGMAVAFYGLYALQFGRLSDHFGAQFGLGLVILALCLAAMAWSWRVDDRRMRWLAAAGFAIATLTLYFKTLGTLLDTSLFFLFAGLIVMALAWGAWRLTRATPDHGNLPI